MPPVLNGKTFHDVAVGDVFEHRVTITDAHLTLGAGLIGDFNPLHVDEAFAQQSRFGGRILHGVLTSALMGAPLGNLFAGTAVGYLEHSARFRAAVKVGDTLEIRWTVVERIDKPEREAGIVVADATATNQHGTCVATAHGKMMVAYRYGPS
jgi:3-hydroxybutyryl-CoA dehydratase